MKNLTILVALSCSVSTFAMKFIDCNGAHEKLTRGQSQALFASDAFQAHKDFSGPIDFTDCERPFLNKKNLKALFRYCDGHKHFWSQRMRKPVEHDEIELLQAGDYIGVEKSLLYNLANRVWPSLQDHAQEFQKTALKASLTCCCKTILEYPRKFSRLAQKGS